MRPPTRFSDAAHALYAHRLAVTCDGHGSVLAKHCGSLMTLILANAWRDSSRAVTRYLVG